MKDKKTLKAAKLPFKTRLIGFLGASVIRMLWFTLRVEVDDRSGILTNPPREALIWAVWHNRILMGPWLHRKYLSERNGAVLTSASKDGAVMAETMRNFGVSAVRGSSSRRGGQAMVELVRWIRNGGDAVLIPDGPRGPNYKLKPGIIKLSQKTGAAIFPLLVEYQNFWQLKSWDQFRVPKPFSKVRVTLMPYESIDPTIDDETFELERLRIEKILSGNVES